jgi:hypothetical protein
MKRIMTAVLALALFSCSRDMDDEFRGNNEKLEGSWRMVAVKDNATGLTQTKPGSITGDVDIIFVAVNTAKGFINGKTPTNTLYADYSLGEIDIITISSVASTKVAETSWGLDFLYNARKADTYSFEQDGKLRIHTEKKTLFFERN